VCKTLLPLVKTLLQLVARLHVILCFYLFVEGTMLERLWLIYELVNAEASGVVQIKVDQADPSNNSPLGFCSITVCVYVRVCACTHACVPMYMQIHPHMYMCMYTHVHAYAPLFVYVHIHIHTHRWMINSTPRGQSVSGSVLASQCRQSQSSAP